MFPAVFNLANLNGSNGFVINGIAPGSQLGWSISGGGDINKDGFNDIIIGAPGTYTGTGTNNGTTYVIFGTKSFSSSLTVSNLNGQNGFYINGIIEGQLGYTVSMVGDVNNDSIDDFIMSDAYTNYNYIIFGQKTWPASFDLNLLNGQNGFLLSSYNVGGTGTVLCGGGDVNGDGIDDFGTAVYNGGFNGFFSGLVVFGQDSNNNPILNVSSINGNNGFWLADGYSYYNHGSCANNLDFNGDGINDVIFTVNNDFGMVFGSKTSFPQTLNFNQLINNIGFYGSGNSTSAPLTASASSVGDLNGDGYDDVCIVLANQNGYLLFGTNQTYPSGFNPAVPNPLWSAIIGLDIDQQAVNCVGGIGDVNLDGLDDFAVGSYLSNNNGQGFIIYGNNDLYPPQLNLNAIDGINGFTIDGISPNGLFGFSVTGLGDINGDNISDFAFSDPQATLLGQNVGQVYVIFGGQ
jgi:hypothetical protein